ncbi:T9SS type A sorting domain-containing protein [uncultured Winogradskyella sp.]|uniref:T9SS type A sorting domain-containing protein n=1 Tax=uncultured Winogradskyella sp. TaxID=395353 RepID=UPI0030DA9285|tara:strand:- start:11443 stop:13131 length:1689 start_codon:yes stop_codon:yes gene_type:complete
MKKNYFFILLFLPVLIFAQTEFTSSITPSLSAYGETTDYPGEGEYQIFLSADEILDKPIIVVDGFDPGDTRNISDLYSSLDFTGTSGVQNLADLVRAEGFDVVLLNFPTYIRAADGSTVDGGADFMERNAMLLVELLDIINTAKAPNSPEQNVIIGPSMGGIIARYALKYMENETIDSDTRLYISFDSPHLGANVPIGLQHQLNFLANNSLSPVAELEPLIDGFLKSPAARQLLVDHFESHLSGADAFTFDPLLTLPQPHSFRTTFESGVSGFPENVRNVAIINGSGIGNTYLAKDGITPVTNGFTMVNTTLPVDSGVIGIIDVEIELYMTPSAGSSQQVSRFFAPLLPPFIPNLESIASSGTTNFDGVDSAPGGLFDLSALTGDLGAGGGIAADFLAALQIDKFSFIPSVSGLALDITEEATDDDINWHHNINLAGRATTNVTPFDNTFLPDDNEPHVQLTEANVAFALTEILSLPLSVSNNNLFEFQLENNPIDSQLVLLSNTNTKANISIIDVTGKIVFNTTMALNNRSLIPVNLASGFYILNITSDNNASFVTKFLAK